MPTHGKARRVVLLAFAAIATLVAIAVANLTCYLLVPVVEDDQVGLAESAVIQQFGPPTHVCTFRAGEVGGELRGPLRGYLPEPNAETRVRELLYCYPIGSERYFWLVRDEDGAWVVFSDAFAAPGVVF